MGIISLAGWAITPLCANAQANQWSTSGRHRADINAALSTGTPLDSVVRAVEEQTAELLRQRGARPGKGFGQSKDGEE